MSSSPPAASIPLPASPPPAESEHDEEPSSISARLDASGTSTPADSAAAAEDAQTTAPAPDVVVQHPSPVPSSTPAPEHEPRSPPPPTSTTPNPTQTQSELPPAPSTPSTAPPPTPPVKPRGAEALRRDSVMTMGSGAFSPGQSTVSLASVPASTGNGPAHRRSLTISRSSLGGERTSHVSAVLITSALDTIASSREAKRAPALKSAVDRALELIRGGEAGSRVREVFEPLRLACESRAEKLQVASLDCIAKLIAYGFFVEDYGFPHPPPPSNVASPPPSPAPGQSAHARNGSDAEGAGGGGALVDVVVGTITACHTENCSDAVSLQVVKALLALVLSPTTLVHQSSLLKAVRTVYNVFLTSSDPVNQTVAQGGLTQMINHVFARCAVSTSTTAQSTSTTPPADASGSSSPPTPAQVLEQARARVNGDARDNGDGALDTPVGENAPLAPSPIPATNGHALPPPTNGDAHPHDPQPSEDGDGRHELTTNDLFLKDAFLVCRAMCKLTMKPLTTEAERDLRNHATRTKLLSLHMVLAILQQHMHVFVAPDAVVWSGSGHAPASFIDMTSQYLCLTLSRNMTSPVPQVFELSIEIFWQMVQGLRTKLKQEIGVLFHEIFLPVLELRTATVRQKAILLGMVRRLCADPQVIVDLYINYDCDSNAPDNIYEHLMNIITKLSGSVGGSSTSDSKSKDAQPPSAPQSPPAHKSQLPPSLTTSALGLPEVPGSGATTEAQLRRQALETLVAVLRSLVTWGITAPKEREKAEAEREREAAARFAASASTDRLNGNATPDRGASTPDLNADDDPSRFESAKQKKTTLAEGLRRFSFKPKKGLEFFRQNGFLEGREPAVVARFLLETEGLSKAAIGEYLGEGDAENIETMHAFVDQIDMRNMSFIAALRNFLQAFRLPGEAQKIDRFMLKFAERYIESNSNTPFANADAAYVLSYSVILLNTDAHNPQIKKRMTKDEFIRNNRGINDNADLPADMLNEIYDEITTNEIRMKGELEASIMKDPSAAVAAAPGGLTGTLATVGRDLQREAYILQSSSMANKTEALFKTMVRAQRRAGSTVGGDVFHRASHFVHVRPMFEAVWLSLLAALSGPLHETDALDVVELCLEGFKCAIRIACFFDMELERNAFVTTLAKFTFLNNLGEMKSKNMEAIKALLDVAVSEGNNLKGSWHEVLSCVSSLEHMQLITSGVNMPDARKGGRTKALPNEALAHESRSTHITVAADMVFSLSHHLSGTAIVDFVQALCDVSWEEIQSSGLSQHPRLFSLQKLVEISYYNMGRIRLEWSNLWDILGEHFNQVCCHSNPHVGFFALDSLRQLAMRFLEKEELPHFKFQKDFLKPFEYTMNHNPNPEIRDMVLQCLQQMVQARVQNMRSGWRTMFGVFSAASRVPTERIAGSAFEIVTRLHKEHFTAIVRYGAFADLTVCVTDFCKVAKYQKISLLAIAMLRGTIPIMLATPECGLAPTGGTAAGTAGDDPMIRFWYPVLFSFYDVIMNGEDLEVRRLALDSLFSTLKRYGAAFPVEFWDTVTQELLFPIFAVLRSSQDLSRFSTQEDMSVWLSTTMIQALRDLIDLYTFYFEILERFLDGLLDLLCVCICQENDTLARIGTSCLQQLLENNVKKLSPARWDRVASTFVKLFKTTTPHQLFDDSLRVEINSASPEPQDASEGNDSTILPAPLSPSQEGAPATGKPSLHERRRIFKQIIVKCVLQLLLIETTNELLRNEDVYSTIPPQNLLQLMQVLDHSYQFARMFNGDKELRTGLWRVGFMKHLPNLLKQESSSAATLVHVLSRMYFDPRAEHQAARPQVAERLLPLGLRVLQDYNSLRSDTQAKNIAAWTPVVAEIVQGFVRLDDRAYNRYLPAIYPVAAELLARDTSPEVRESLRDYFMRVGYSQGIVERPA